MSNIKTAAQLVAACKRIATDRKTLYVLGCIGAPMTALNKQRYLEHQAFNRKLSRKTKINAAGTDVFGFDCVCLIKSLLWGWCGDGSKAYGGATYLSNGVPDVNADGMIALCKDVSTDFTKIQPGEVVWIKGHIGVYIGDGLVVECTYNWKDGVQITAVHNIGKKAGYNGRKWTKHGKLPWVSYDNVSKLDTITDPNKADYTLGMRILREGCEGEDVRALQILLNDNGCHCGDTDGIFGTLTGNAVEQYQIKKSLTKDRVAGINTMSNILGLK